MLNVNNSMALMSISDLAGWLCFVWPNLYVKMDSVTERDVFHAVCSKKRQKTSKTLLYQFQWSQFTKCALKSKRQFSL